MKLTHEDIKKLSHWAENKIRVVVSGKNAIGQEFTTEGYIMAGFTSTGKPNWITELGFALYVGQEMKNRDGETFKLFVPLYTAVKDGYYDYDKLYVKNVVEKSTEKLVFSNPDFDEIIKDSRKAQMDKPSYMHRMIRPLSNYAKKLVSLIGKPVVYMPRKESVVIKTIDMNNYYPTANATTGYHYLGLPGLEEGDIVLDEEAYTNLEKYEGKKVESKTENTSGKFEKLINERDAKMSAHCQEYSWATLCNYPDEREWYTKNIWPIDQEIIRLANILIVKFSIPCRAVKQISDVYSNQWLMKFIEKKDDQEDSAEK